jgi:aryl-alcohol dehydrogenase-like predicted oxidoreductase
MAIEHKRLGKHGVFVSNICLGTMNFGWHTAQEESFKIMDRGLELGINFFDTADVYGRGGEQRDTEEILGRWFAQGAGRRNAVVLVLRSSILSNAKPTSQNPTLTGFRSTLISRNRWRTSRCQR